MPKYVECTWLALKVASGYPMRFRERLSVICLFFFQAEDGIRDYKVTGVQTCALPILIHGAQKVPWDRSGFNYALVRTPSRRNTGSCAAATVRAVRPSEPHSHVAISDVAHAQQEGAKLAPTPQESRTLDYTRRDRKSVV